MRLALLPVALVFALVAAGCGSAEEAADPAPAPIAQTATLAIEQVLDTSGPMYIEGFLWQLAILDEDGNEVFDGDLEETKHSESLPEGRYTIKSAVKPCTGNCGYASDTPEGACEADVDVVAPTTKVRVDIAAGQECSITTL